MKRKLFLFVLYFLFTISSSKKLPDYYPKCHKVKTDADIPVFKKCFEGVAFKWRSYLREGVKELRIPPLEPLIIPLITVKQNGTISYILKMHNTSFSGLTDYVLQDFQYAIKPLTHMNGTLYYKDLKLNGNYNIAGNFGGIFFKGGGLWNGNFSDVYFTTWADEELYSKKNKQYLNLVNVGTETRFGKASMNLQNFFGDNELLNSALNNFINDYSNDILESLKPDIKKVMNSVIMQVKSRILKKVPYDDMYLPD